MTHFFYFCHSRMIIINNMAFSLDCGTLWLEMGNGAFHTALSTKVTMWCGLLFPASFYVTCLLGMINFAYLFYYLTYFYYYSNSFVQFSTLIISSNPANSQSWALKQNVMVMKKKLCFWYEKQNFIPSQKQYKNLERTFIFGQKVT